jgi:hypothetical protein
MIILFKNRDASLHLAYVKGAYYEEKVYSDLVGGGLIIHTAAGNLCFGNISKEEGNNIILELYDKGKIDLSKYENKMF